MNQAAIAYTELVREILAEFPDFKIVPKRNSTWMKVADVLLRLLSFGRMRSFMTSFVTIMGSTVYVPDSWALKDPLGRCVTLRHERVHLRQKKRIGEVYFTFLYFFWAFPFIFAYKRRDFEQEAYEESMRALVEYYGTWALADELYREDMIGHFTSAEYLWMWPFRPSIETWYDGVVSKLSHEIARADST